MRAWAPLPPGNAHRVKKPERQDEKYQREGTGLETGRGSAPYGASPQGLRDSNARPGRSRQIQQQCKHCSEETHLSWDGDDEDDAGEGPQRAREHLQRGEVSTLSTAARLIITLLF